MDAVENAAWGDEDEIDIDADLNEGAVEEEETKQEHHQPAGDIFIPPSLGSDPLQLAAKRHPLLAPLHVAIGDFPKALDLLKKQLAIGNFEPLKHLFVDLHTLSKLKLQTLPHIQPLSYPLQTTNHLPLTVFTLATLHSKYAKGIDLTTKGEFSLALDAFRSCLQTVPLTLLLRSSQQQQQELNDLIKKVTEYITAMRIEIERKRLGTAVRKV